MPGELRKRALEELHQSLAAADAVRRHCEGRNLVFGEGNPEARLVLVGEAPGGQEDRARRPFVGPAGRLLNEALAAAGTRRDDVWITNVVKCRPTVPSVGGRVRNRPPSPLETADFLPWLLRELEIVRPGAIICLGATAAGALLGRPVKITQERGTWFEGPSGIPAMVTYHPAYLLRRASDQDQRFLEFVHDIRQAASLTTS